ncbi:MAG: hypothetical protein WCE74_26060, partial [Pseudolabrys sp.]
MLVQHALVEELLRFRGARRFEIKLAVVNFAKAGWANETPTAALAATLNRVRTIFPSPIVLASKGNLRVVLTLIGALDVK